MHLTSEQSRAARDLLRWTQEDLADAAGVSIFTVRDFERGRTPDSSTLAVLRRAFEGAGIDFESGVALAKTRRG